MNIQNSQKKKLRQNIVFNIQQQQESHKQDLEEINSNLKIIFNQIIQKCKSLFVCQQSIKEGKNSQKINETSILELQNDQKLFDILDRLTTQERMDKAIRHFHDALLFRTSRHDIDGKDRMILQLIWRWTNSSFWSTWLWMITIIYQILTFFEPVNRNDKSLDEESFKKLIITESIMLFYLICDFLLNFYLFCKAQEKKSILIFFLKQRKLAFKGLFDFILLLDFLYCLISYPVNTLRFGRIIRPLVLISYSKDLRRTIKGIFGSSFNIIILLIFQFIVMALWAFIGLNTVGMIEGEIVKDDNIIDYSDFFKLYNLLYMLSIMDYYPDVQEFFVQIIIRMMPPVQISYIYMIYFIPYILLFMFLLMPIPLAIVYEGYRANRMKIVISDRLKQRESLLACFLCLDSNSQGFISQKTFHEFAQLFYGSQLSKQEISELYILLDNNESGKISIEEFFNILQVIDENRKYTIKNFKPLRHWIIFREFVNNKFQLLRLLEGHYFALIMFLVTIVNCAMIITSIIITPDSQTEYVFDIFDYIFFTIYSVEVIIKIIGYGLETYFDDSWNNFDFFLVMFQLCFEYLFYSMISQNFVQQFKANRMLRLAKIQKVFRLFRAFRTVKVVSVFMVGVELFNTVKDLFVKILICIPVVFKQIVVVWIVFFIYGILSVEIFSSIEKPYHKSPYNAYDCSVSKKALKFFKTNEEAAVIALQKIYNQQIDWSTCDYADFNTFWGALLMLFQVFTGDLSTQVFNFSYKLQTMALPAVFFGSFIFISVFLLALLSGLIWEVFTIVEDIWKEEREFENKLIQSIEFLEEPEQKAQLQQDQIQQEDNSFNKKKMSINLNPRKTFFEDHAKKNQPKEVYHIFTLDILADDDEENLYFSDSDLFDQFDKYSYASHLNYASQFKDKNLEQEQLEDDVISDDQEGKVSDGAVFETNLHNKYKLDRMMSIIGEVNDSNQEICDEDPKDFGFQEFIGSKQMQMVSRYMLQEKPENLPSRLLTTPVSSTQEDQLKNQNISNAGSQIGQIYIDEQNILNDSTLLLQEYLTSKFISLLFFSEIQRLNKAEGIFSIQDNSVNEFFINQIKDDLKGFENFNRLAQRKDVNIQNHRFLIENAILKGADQREIRKQELNHFFKLFGQQFEQLREMKVIVTSLQQIQSRLLYHLHCSLKYPNINLKFFFQIVLSIEQLISNSLLPGNSFCKFTFGDYRDNFYYYSFEKGSFRLNCLGNQTWKIISNFQPPFLSKSGDLQDVSEKILSKIFFANDITNTKNLHNILVQKEIKSYFTQVKDMGQSVQPNFGKKHGYKQEYYTIFGQIINSDKDFITDHLNKLNDSFLKQYPNLFINILQSFQIWFFIEKEDLQSHQIFKDKYPTEKNISFEQNLNNNQDSQNQFQTHFSFQPDISPMKIDVEIDKPSQEYFKDEDQYPYLPFPYIIELAKDIIQIVEMNKMNMFIQASQMMHLRRCYSLVQNRDEKNPDS